MTGIRILGEPPLAKTAEGQLVSRIGTVFPRSRTLVTLPGIHAIQRIAYIHDVKGRRELGGLPHLSEEDEMLEWHHSVDLIMEEDCVLIRPDPENMSLAFEADELLQELVSKVRIKFLNLLNEKVRFAIKERGENWRIAPLPRSPEEMTRMILSSITPIGGRSIYYYSRDTGTRFLTYQQFCELGNLPHDELLMHLKEIRDCSGHYNRMGHPEVEFFATADGFGRSSFPSCDSQSLIPDDPHECFERLKEQFRHAVREELREDNVESPEWRALMFASLIGQKSLTLPEEQILGLSSEFYMQVEWLPGGRIEEGELMLDSLFDEVNGDRSSPEMRVLCDEKARGFIFNFVREFGDLEYVNVGRVIGSLSQRPTSAGRRDVYVAEIKEFNSPHPVVRILRMQKWGIQEHLDEGKELLQAIMEAEDYTEYILDRRLGCRQLGMNLPARIMTRKICEHYYGSRHFGQQIWSTYFERDYIPGIATDKLPVSRFKNAAYAIKFAELMGVAAAANIVLGRMNLNNAVLFDDGDEVMIEDGNNFPRDLILSDHTGTFMDYKTDLRAFAEAYANPIRRRLATMSSPAAVIESYLSSFTAKLMHTKEEYLRRKRSFDTLFKHRPRDEHGSFAYRWECILNRLYHLDPAGLTAEIRSHFRRS